MSTCPGPRAPRPLRWGRTLLGGQQPLLAVATTGASAQQAAEQAARARRAGADLVELRLDLVRPSQGGTVLRPDLWRQAVRAVSAAAGALPVLVTLRTSTEGGQAVIDDPSYAEALRALVAVVGQERRKPDQAGTGAVALDVEHARGCLPDIVSAAQDAGLDVVASRHELTSTPSLETIVALLAQMQHEGASAAKVAVTPRDAADVAVLLAATTRARLSLEIPVVTVSMGLTGQLSRLLGARQGSALTFVTTGDAASAPGQLPLEVVRRGLEAWQDPTR